MSNYNILQVMLLLLFDIVLRSNCNNTYSLRMCPSFICSESILAFGDQTRNENGFVVAKLLLGGEAIFYIYANNNQTSSAVWKHVICY